MMRTAYPVAPGSKQRGPSRDASIRVAPEAAVIRQRVLAFLRDSYPLDYSADEIAMQLHLSILSVRPRVSELGKMELVERTSRRATNESGFSASCWRARP